MWKIIQGGALDSLRGLESDSVDCILTSPPYWGLRDYGVEGQLGLEPHPQEYLEKLWEIFDEVKRVLKPTGCVFVNLGDTYGASSYGDNRKESPSSTLVGSWRGNEAFGNSRHIATDGSWLKPKNLLLIPARFAIGMQDRGWWLRNDIVWHKPNAMPSSVKDRFSCTWEHMYFFTKSARYAFDLDAVREAVAESSIKRVALMDSRAENKAGSQELSSEAETVKTLADTAGNGLSGSGDDSNCHQRYKGGQGTVASRGDNVDHLVARPHPLGKNPGDCWIIPTAPFPAAHFATFPPNLIIKPIRAGCPAQVCVECGKPHERIVEEQKGQPRDVDWGKAKTEDGQVNEGGPRYAPVLARKTIGWQPTCECTIEGWKKCSECGGTGRTISHQCSHCNGFGREPYRARRMKTEPGITLDPFMGSGTTGLVAIQEGRRFIGIDISEEYCSMARERLGKAQAPLL